MTATDRRYAEHISSAARMTLEACRAYPTADAFLNPRTRRLAQELAEAPLRATLDQIDFPYTLEDETLAGRPCVRYRTGRTDPARPLIVYLHASALLFGSPRVNAAAILPVCELSGCEAVGISYSLAPDAPYPTQLEEIEAAYCALIEREANGRPIVLAGDSAGGMLALASLRRWRRSGLHAPVAVVLWSPLTDATGASDTMRTLAGHDPLFSEEVLRGMGEIVALYAPGSDLDAPDISPVYADYRGAPPMMIHVGSREVLLGDAARLAERARRDGVDISLRVFDGMFHLFHMHWRLDEARASAEDIAAFIERVVA